MKSPLRLLPSSRSLAGTAAALLREAGGRGRARACGGSAPAPAAGSPRLRLDRCCRAGPPRAAIARVVDAIARDLERAAGALVATAPLAGDAPAPPARSSPPRWPRGSRAGSAPGRGDGPHRSRRAGLRGDRSFTCPSDRVGLRVCGRVPVPHGLGAHPRSGQARRAFARYRSTRRSAFLAPSLISASVAREGFEGDIVARLRDLDMNNAPGCSTWPARITLLRRGHGALAAIVA
jgi:hypothetical protein